jgi:hypothetical protein
MDHHADRRDAKRAAARFGHVTTNPGLRITQRALAARQQGARIMRTPSGETCQEYVGPATGTGSRRVHGVAATKHYVVGGRLDIWVCTTHANSEYRDLIPVADFTTTPPTFAPKGGTQ